MADRVALVTGGSRGIGRAIALRLAREGADVAISYFRDRESAEKTRAEIEETGRRCIAIKCHAGDTEKVRRLAAETREALGAPGILVNNAASGVFRPLAEIDDRAWTWTMDTNARALLVLAQELAPAMAEAGGGSIVALTSLGSERALPHYGVIGASKAALESLVRSLAVELSPHEIVVNAVSAGVVDTTALRTMPGREALLHDAGARTPAGRLVTPEEVAAVVSFLCSDAARMIRGQTIVVDGGFCLTA